MQRFIIGAVALLLLNGAVARAQAPAAQNDADTAARAERAAEEARYWAQEAARTMHGDPRNVSRDQAAYKSANRLMRTEARKWSTRSSSRPIIYEPAAGWPISPTSPTWYAYPSSWANYGHVHYGWYPGYGMVSSYQWVPGGTLNPVFGY
jgi:hypothetical protein